ncbi:MAG TPA: SMC family ATPase [Acidimicrobiia bacterium]|nr:SMC family ATPase [Acidimicrobiia bacterium]
MRPEVLTLKGFGPFRERTEIDFREVELFALTGPTGAGKTSVLDGICFALYGSVPRHGKGAVAPVVTQGQLEAVVALTFSIGEEEYQVSRVVRKDAKGRANTDEASLERRGEPLAVGADAVTQQVESLLGLDYGQFTTCVLLPQGEFARFLHHRPSERQDLLWALLDLEIFNRVAQLASLRHKEAEGRLRGIEQRLSELGELTGAQAEAARRREEELSALLTWVEKALPELAEVEEEIARSRGELAELEGQQTLLTKLVLPADLAVLLAAGEAAALAAAEAKQAVEQAETELAQLSGEERELPKRAQVKQWIDDRELEVKLEGERQPARVALEECTTRLQAAQAAVTEAEANLRAVQDADRAAHLRRSLKVGDPCPVCGQPLAELLSQEAPADLVRAERALEGARAGEAEARQLEAAASRRVDTLTVQLSDLERRLEGVGDTASLLELSTRLEAFEVALAAARQRLADSRQASELAQRRQAEIGHRQTKLASGLQTAWTELLQVGLSPPSIDFSTPVEGWRVLDDWRQQSLPPLVEASEKAHRLLAEAEDHRTQTGSALKARLAEAALDPGLTHPRDAVVDALTTARAQRNKIEAGLEELAIRSGEKASVTLDAARAQTLWSELKANRFKQWVFDEVFRALVAGANARLLDLTRGQYQLSMDGKDFEVIDNLAAGNRRSVKTLSGGETFLVSLALALSLAEQVAEAAAAHRGSSGRLDSFFLDEGFGTLDAESMDVVASVISELGAAGKTVGIVTHVAELAEQIPVRYQVEKAGGSARVLRVG